jgi:polyhydroxyalkanoate synthesis repressor PhaR
VVRLIKRYGSRKLYDTEESRYVSLEDLGNWIRDGDEVRVVDNVTSEDVTAQTLSQVILEDSRRGAPPPSEMLHTLIRQGGEWVTSGVGQLNEGVDRLLQAGAERLPPLRQMREETETLRRRLEELEASLAGFAGTGPSRATKRTVSKGAEGNGTGKTRDDDGIDAEQRDTDDR